MILEKEYTGRDFARMAWYRRWLIVLPFLTGVYATLAVSSQLPDEFRSEMLIQVVPQRVPDSYVQSTVTVRTEDRISALSQQVMSRTELERLITQLDLYPEQRTSLPMQDVVELMRNDIDVEVILGNQVGGPDAEAFYVRYTYPEAETSARVTGQLGSLFIQQNARDRGALADGTNEFLQTQLLDARNRLEDQEGRLERFRKQHAGRLPAQLQFNMQAMQSAQLQLQAHLESLARDRDRRLMLERLYNDAQAESVSPEAAAAPGGVQDEQLMVGGTARQRLAQARATLAALEGRLQSQHPDIARTRRLIADLEKEVLEDDGQASSGIVAAHLTPQELERRARLRGMRAEIESLGRQIEFKEAEENRLRGTIEEYQDRIESVPGIESEWIALSRDYDTQQEAYKDLLSKSEQAKVAADLERRQVGEQFRVLDPPRAPVRPTSPNRLQISSIGAILSLVLGIALAALTEVRDATFKTADEVVDLLNLPVVAQVPYVESALDRRWRATRRLAASAGGVLVAACGGYAFWTLKLWKYIW